MRYLLLFALLLLVFWIMRKNRKHTSTPPPAARPPEKMVSCAHCGVNLPLSESVRSGNRHYCCLEHLRSEEVQGR